MPTNQENERFDWGPYQDGEMGWADGPDDATDNRLGLSELLDRAEQQTTIKDAETNIQSYRPLAGRTFEATDVEREYIGDGTAWHQRATRGPNPTFESATVNGPANVDELLVGTDGPATSFNDLGILASVGYQSGDVVSLGGGVAEDSSAVSFTDTSLAFQKQATGGYYVSPNTVSQLRARFVCTLSNDTNTETTSATPSLSTMGYVDELKVTSSAGADNEAVDSGWVDVSSKNSGGPIYFGSFAGSVSGGTGEINPNFETMVLLGLEIQ